MASHDPIDVSTLAEMLRHFPTGTERGKWRAVISAVAHACSENGAGDLAAVSLLEAWDPPYPGVRYAAEIANLHGNYFTTTGWLVSAALANGFKFPQKEKTHQHTAGEIEKLVKFQLLEALPKFCESGNGVFWRARGEKTDFSLWTPDIAALPDVSAETLSTTWFRVRGIIKSRIVRGQKHWTVFAAAPVEKI